MNENDRIWIEVKGYSVAAINKVARTSLIAIPEKGGKNRKPCTDNTVGFIRNPYDRLVSCYKDKSKNSRYWGQCFTCFSDFVRYVYNMPDEIIDKHARSQSWFMEPFPQQIIRFEEINEWFASIGITLKRKNTSNKKSWKHYYYDKNLMKLVRERYKKDFKIYERTGVSGVLLKRA